MNNIVLIDDDEFLNEDLEFFIKEKGHNLVIYTKADDVIKAFENGKLKDADLIIIDIIMPSINIDVSGFPKDYETGEVLYKKFNNKYPEKKFIIISAKDFSDMHVDFNKEKNVGTVQKPFDATASKLMSLINN